MELSRFHYLPFRTLSTTKFPVGGIMARINVDDKFRADPRFEMLTREFSKTPNLEKFSKQLAYGCIIALWDLGMAYWKNKKALIPKYVFEQLPGCSELVRALFVDVRGEYVYCRGAEENWAFLFANSERGRVAGLASARARMEKYGTSQPANKQSMRTSPEQSPNMFEQDRTTPKYSSSSSDSKRERGNANEHIAQDAGASSAAPILETKKPGKAKKVRAPKPPDPGLAHRQSLWELYSKCFLERYGRQPYRDAHSSKSIKEVSDVLTTEAEAIIIQFFKSNNKFYLQESHHPRFIMTDCNKLRLELTRKDAARKQLITNPDDIKGD